MQVLEGRTATDEWNMPPEADMRKDVLLPTSSCIMFYIVLLSLDKSTRCHRLFSYTAK